MEIKTVLHVGGAMSVELIHGDCMDYMRSLPDNVFELAIVDPPYGINESGKTNCSRGSAAGSTKWAGSRNTTGAGVPSTQFSHKEWDKKPPPPEYFIELRRVSRNQIIWGANHFIDRIAMPSPCWIVWDKVNGATDFADCELAYTSFKTAVRKFQYTWNGMLQGDMKNKELRIHPTQKPVKLYDWLLSNYAKPGDRILDTHLGSGSSAIASHYAGHDFVGIELDADYYEAATKRFNEATKQMDIFGEQVA
jgi:site-specific DNA-methyltransferase (adenine-specific)